ncbi:MAG TPA: discoidin domain-containing protein, partial [Gemmatimonadaceae bacterium]
LKDSEAAHAIDGDSATSWRGAPGAALTLDLHLQREFGGLAIAWDTTATPATAIVATSPDARSWSTVRTIRGNRRAWTPLRLPEHEARFIRITLPQGGGVAELSIQPLDWAARENDLLRRLAARERRGAYPRVWSDEASYWTVIGLDRDSAEALINTDGAIEVGRGAFSLEPFVTVGDQQYDWSNVTATATLAPGALPIPGVHWQAAGMRLSIEAFAARIEGASCLVARYRVTNQSGRTAPVTLRLALRPMQVNAPWQFLQVEGGFAPIRTLRMTTTGARVNDAHHVYTVGTADRVGAGAFDAGSVRALPTSRSSASVSDAEGLASGVFVWSARLAHGGTRQFAITAPLHTGLRPDPRCRLRTLAQVATARVRTVASWHEALSTFEVSLPDSANPLVETLRASLAWILINRDGAALQPGSRSYERSWIRDGALTSTALLRLGHAAAVKDFILWYAPFQFASGKIPCCIDRQGAGPVPEHDSHGQFVYLVAEYFRQTHDTVLVRQVWPNVTRAIAYQDSLRRTRRTALYQAPDSAHLFGILPPSISHEGYSAKPAYSYWDNFFALRGYKDAATLALVLRDPLASRHAQLRDEFAGDLRASISAAMRRHGIPFIPGAADLGDFDPTSTTIALSPVGAETLLPHAAAESTFARYWRESVARERGTRDWENYTPYELRSVGALVRLGKPREAHELLQFFFGHQRPEGFRHWAEVVWRDPSTPRFIGDMPHTWVASDFVRSALDFFGYEREGDSSFVVGAGVLPEWLEGEGLRVRGVRTHYGTLALTMARRGAVVEAEVRGLRSPPGGVVLRPPVGRRFTSVAGDGTLQDDGSIRLLRLPARLRAGVSARDVSVSPARQGRPSRADDVAIKQSAGLGGALERFVIHMDDAEPPRVTQTPLEVVEQRPGEVAAHVGTGLHRRAHRGDVGAIIVDAQHVVDAAIDRLGRIIERGAVFGHVQGDVPVPCLDPQKRFGEGLGIDLPPGLAVGA